MLLLLQIGAALFSMLAWLIVLREGIFGTGTQASLGEGSALFSFAALYASWFWPIAATAQRMKGAALALAVLDVLWVLLAAGSRASSSALCLFARPRRRSPTSAATAA